MNNINKIKDIVTLINNKYVALLPDQFIDLSLELNDILSKEEDVKFVRNYPTKSDLAISIDSVIEMIPLNSDNVEDRLEFKSVKEVSRYLEVYPNIIKRVLEGRQKSVKGYKLQIVRKDD